MQYPHDPLFYVAGTFDQPSIDRQHPVPRPWRQPREQCPSVGAEGCSRHQTRMLGRIKEGPDLIDKVRLGRIDVLGDLGHLPGAEFRWADAVVLGRALVGLRH